MAKRARGDAITLDSFLDILTCLEGVLMLIIISTGIDAAQTKVLIPTPMESESTKRPVYIECRNNELFLIPVETLRSMSNAKLEELAQKAKGDSLVMLQGMGEARVTNEAFEVDLTYALLGQIAIRPVRDAVGYKIEDYAKETVDGWFGRIITALNKEQEMVAFLVRDNSYSVFKQARRYAWQARAEVSFELLAVDEPVKFGLGGQRLGSQ